MTTSWRRLINLAQRLISGAALTVIALVISDAWFDDLVMTTTGLVVAVVVFLLPGEALDPLLGWLARRDKENRGLPGFVYPVVVAVELLGPFWVLPIAAAISPGLDFNGVAAYLGTVFTFIGLGFLAWVLLYRRPVRLDEST